MHGLKPADYQLKSIAGTEGRLACLYAGECSAVIVGQPSDLDAIKKGNHRLGSSSAVGAVIFNLEVVNRDWAEKNRDTLVRYHLRVDAAALPVHPTIQNRDEITKTVADLSHEPDDVVNEIMKNQEQVFTKNAELNMANFRHTLELIKEYAPITKPLPPTEHFVDLSYAKAAGIR